MVEHTHFRSVFMFRKSFVAATVAGAAAFAFIAGAAPVEAQLDDATIVAIFDAANTADIETGELAMQRGQSDEVRNFGTMLARDHKAVRQMGRDLARKLNVTPTPPADTSSAMAHARAMATLRSVPAAEFDQAFLAHEVAFHQAVLDAVSSTLMPAIRNDELKALVQKVAPAFVGHRDAAAQMARKLAVNE